MLLIRLVSLPCITFHMSCLLLFIKASSGTPFQLLVLASLSALLVFLPTSVHSWQFSPFCNEVHRFILLREVPCRVCRSLVFPTLTSATAFRI